MTTPSAGKILGKIVPRQENSNFMISVWSRTIMVQQAFNFL
ncbi:MULTISPECIES: hypothetical protein [unclassified Acinetobacter]|nr:MULTISPECIES: hypothetical protein [unclassified Acinetobacter]